MEGGGRRAEDGKRGVAGAHQWVAGARRAAEAPETQESGKRKAESGGRAEGGKRKAESRCGREAGSYANRPPAPQSLVPRPSSLVPPDPSSLVPRPSSLVPYFFLLLLAGLGIVGCQRGPQSVVIGLSGETMGTSYHVKLSGLPEGVTAETIQAEIDERLERVNDQMSTYRPESELSRFNRAPAGQWFAVSPATAKVVAAALAASRSTEGAFDVTVGPLVNLWHFGPDRGAFQLPTPESTAEARERVGYLKLQVQPDPPALRKEIDGVYVDLSAIAKGYGVDVVAEYLEMVGVKNYLVEIGGEVRAAGVKPNGEPWVVAIEKPVESVRELYKAFALRNQAMATSGGYRNFFEFEGRRYSHTIDPRTGRPVEHKLASATVVSDTCMEADAMATALMVLGPEAGYNIAEELDLAVLLLIVDGDRLTAQTTPAFRQRVASVGGP